MLKIRTLLLFLLGLFNLQRFSIACSCVGFGPACTEAVRRETVAVFLGTVEGVTTANVKVSPNDRESLRNSLIEREVRLRIDEGFKGATTKTVSVFTASSEGACGFPFKVGEQYLVYAVNYLGKLYTGICERTMPASFAAEDLKYLRGMKAGSTKIFGEYKRYTFDPTFVPKFTPSIMDHYRPPEEEYEALAPMEGETVTLSSETGQTRSIAVDKEGKFFFLELPPGKYKIAVTTPPKLAQAVGYIPGLGSAAKVIDVPPNGCAEVVFRTQPDGRIEGLVHDAHGQPLQNVEVIAWDTEKANRSGFNFYKRAAQVHDEPNGRFSLGPLPPGKYKIGAYVWTLPQGFPGMQADRDRLKDATLNFFGGSRDFDSASAIILDSGQHVKDVELTIRFDPAEWTNVP